MHCTSMTTALNENCMKAIMKDLDPGLRLHLSRTCPSLRQLDQEIPLKIQNLHISTSRLHINTTTFKLGIVRHYPDVDTPEFVKKENSEGGTPYDVDIYGLRRSFKAGTPDVDYHEQQPEAAWIIEMERLQEELMELELYRNPDKKKIENLHGQLAPLYHKYNNTTPPFDNYLQLMVISKWSQRIEKMSYGKLLHQAMEYLVSRIFGRRRIFLDSLKLQGVPLPCDVHLIQVNGTCVTPDVLELMWYLLPNLESLDSLKVCDEDDEEFADTDAEMLVLHSFPGIQHLRKLKNKEVFVKQDCFSALDVLLLVEDWLMTGRDLGTCFKFEVDSDEMDQVLRCLEDIEKMDNARRAVTGFDFSPKCVVIPMPNNTMELMADYQQDSKDNNLFIFTLKVQNIGECVSVPCLAME
ncbi:hypothetical protein GCK72_007786 [Caenorhabditis remanei]|uniref:F-box domain-containing protein n=1 Tax=Caenorhabditis remanei TaxID=31234 RepID=A0A6A5HNC3_CAERE|nr:hypothetical protein GCK72_007786 [Caenorhabditis remanei]KAF1767827.1 hypothetical protein GCK72_007786 [Caenorhabditis remanei]